MAFWPASVLCYDSKALQLHAAHGLLRGAPSIHKAFLNLTHGATDNEEQFLTSEQVSNIPALRVNPFRDQICKVFSTNKNGLFSFEDFLEMFSAFSANASLAVKIDYAFQIFDLNGNNYIDQEDIRNVILRLTNGLMDEPNIVDLTQNILDEGDLNNDDMLSFVEFESMIGRSPDFQKRCPTPTSLSMGNTIEKRELAISLASRTKSTAKSSTVLIEDDDILMCA
ncbi:calcium and integrin-binding family member 4-like [Pristis pectinata]|uniref:calcium and integrin-binding family member 4-like n=1 Tax=Pristis pectinata TaxID=685728 RepID=UPI00223D9FD7|nr:calcium and integrin-binding family member 4-like [Pristis pectinata]